MFLWGQTSVHGGNVWNLRALTSRLNLKNEQGSMLQSVRYSQGSPSLTVDAFVVYSEE